MSIAICVIVLVSFGIFAIGETKSASANQQQQLSAEVGQGAVATPAAHHESALHEAIDDAADAFTSPFANVVSAASGEWAVRVVKLLLALVVYGFGLGYLARALRVRV